MFSNLVGKKLLVSLKLNNNLYTGPFSFKRYTFKKNKHPSLLLIISKEGKPYNPKFKLIEVIITENEDIKVNEFKSKKLIKFLENNDIHQLQIYIKEFDLFKEKEQEERNRIYKNIKNELVNSKEIYLNY